MAEKLIAQNKKAFFDYFIEEKYEAGISLTGAEVKSIKLGHINLKDSYCSLDRGEAYLKNCHITPYEKGSVFNAEAKRARKLLLHKKEISKLIGKVKEKGLSLIPIKIYFSGNYIKLEIAVCRGKKLYDKRASIKEKELTRTVSRDIKNYIG